ncbi:MAG TPA: hypothetical protein VFN31_00025 [Candidatus Saccharimonadales bacterium]|nr:hypothetical protein [Candidatus Saccharimonadales bacterium]
MNKKTKKVNNKHIWFYKVRGSYLPASRSGWLTYIPYVGYMVFAYVVGIKDISKVWVACLFILSNWVSAFAVMTMLAIKKS